MLPISILLLSEYGFAFQKYLALETLFFWSSWPLDLVLSGRPFIFMCLNVFCGRFFNCGEIPMVHEKLLQVQKFFPSTGNVNTID